MRPHEYPVPNSMLANRFRFFDNACLTKVLHWLLENGDFVSLAFFPSSELCLFLSYTHIEDHLTLIWLQTPHNKISAEFYF